MSPATGGQNAEDRRPRLERTRRTKPSSTSRGRTASSSRAVRDGRPHRRRRLPPVPGRSQGQNKLLPACVTMVEEGMEVTTDSERLQNYRRMILELLFTERNHVCSVCVSNGHCELQMLGAAPRHHARQLSLSLSQGRSGRVARPLRDRPQPLHPVYALRARLRRNRRRAYLGHHGARHRCQVITDLNEPWGSSETCTSCGKCVHVCPTGALFEKGRSVAEMMKRRQFLPYLTMMREENE